MLNSGRVTLDSHLGTILLHNSQFPLWGKLQLSAMTHQRYPSLGDHKPGLSRQVYHVAACHDLLKRWTFGQHNFWNAMVAKWPPQLDTRQGSGAASLDRNVSNVKYCRMSITATFYSNHTAIYHFSETLSGPNPVLGLNPSAGLSRLLPAPPLASLVAAPAIHPIRILTAVHWELPLLFAAGLAAEAYLSIHRCQGSLKIWLDPCFTGSGLCKFTQVTHAWYPQAPSGPGCNLRPVVQKMENCTLAGWPKKIKCSVRPWSTDKEPVKEQLIFRNELKAIAVMYIP